MLKIFVVAAAALSLTACTASQQGATVGGVGGAVVGSAVTGGSAAGAIVGAGIGAIAGAAAGDALQSRNYRGNPNQCVYRNPRTGVQYVAACPRG